MTTNMNFGPEWMRGSFPKHNNNNNNNNNNSFASSDILDSLLPFDDSHQQENVNPFKYSKGFMLSLYKPDFQLPSDFKQHEYVTIEECLAPLAFEELTESEKKLLSGPVHSEVSRRMGGDKSNAQRHRGGDLYSGSPMQSPASENGPVTPGGGRLSARKGRTGDYFSKDQPLKRGESDLLKKRDQSDEMTLGKLDDEGKETNWGTSSKGSSGLGAFSSSGLFEDNDTPFKSSTEALFGNTSSDLGGLSSVKKPEDTKWFYRDPSGQVQGPFEAQEMQDWYKAGFFTFTLMLCREDESVFEPLMVLTQKVGNEDQPFLAPRPRPVTTTATPSADLFGGSHPADSLFRNGPDLQSKYMPFGGVPTTPGGSMMDSFLGGNAPTTPLYQSPYNTYGGSLLRDNRWGNDSTQPQASPSWLNPNTGELFGGPTSPLGASPFMPQQQQPGLNPVFGSNMNSPGLFDYQRTVNDQLEQHQQYLHMLQQNQQQRSMQFQQQFNQMQFPDQQQQPQQPQAQNQQLQQQQPSPPQQNAFKNVQLENVTNNTPSVIGSNHASPVLRPNILAGGWGSVPGTPVGDVPSSPWGSIVSTAIPTKVSEELQAKAPGAQSPRAPSSPKKAIEKPVKTTKTIVESFADIQLAEEKKAAAAANAAAIAAASAASAAAASAPIIEEATTTAKVSTPAPVITKPVVSLREIQEEELRIANEKKARQAKSATTIPNWAASNNTPLHTTTTGTWSQPAHKPLSLREIQEMEAKNAGLNNKKETSAAEYLTQQQQLANATPSTLSWGVVVPNSKSVAGSANAASASNTSNSTAWTAPTGPKKTLREIQQEEELAMKKKNAKAIKSSTTAAAIAAVNAPTAASRAYAVPSAPSAGGAWTTVTSTRAPKPASTPAPAVAAPAPGPVRWEPVAKPAATRVRNTTPSGPSEEFRRWCRKALRDLNSGVNQEEIVGMLLSFPVDANAAEIIEDVIYANSLRIDGKRFSQEFMKRRKADIAGRLDIVTAGLEDEDEDDFKVVVTKKGKKKTIA